jgi:SAM-dependent methyltransferase
MRRTLHRPEPILRTTARPVHRHTPPRQVAEKLRDGEVLRVTDRYSTGAEILGQLRSILPSPPPSAPYAERKAAARTHREAAMRLQAPIENGRLALEGARPNGFLRQLYPKLPTFALPFIAVQELQAAWTRFEEGVHLAVLGHRVHPFYGTYAPTRVSHLELFATWLSTYEGPRDRGIDVGTGCGVLAFMLARAGFDQVLATDINPNAIESVARELQRLPSAPRMDLRCGDLLCNAGPVDLIVFNPPWIRGDVDEVLDGALYFQDGLFERFFDQAVERLRPDGRIAVVFSTVLALVQPDVPHPIRAELERGRLRLVDTLRRRVAPSRDAAGKRRKTREKVEVWELALPTTAG